MNQTALLRVVWKEYRQLRPLWLVVAAMVLLVQILTLVVQLASAGSVPVDELFGIGLLMPLLYALGCGAVLFAGEHDSGTYDFQRALPLSASRLAAGKIGLGLFSTLLMPPVLCLSAWLLAGGRLPSMGRHVEACLAGLLALVALFAWSVLWSLLLRRVLWAVVLSAVSAFLTLTLAVPCSLWLASKSLSPHWLENFASSSAVPIVSGLLLVADAWLARRWLQEYPLPWHRPRRQRPAIASEDRRPIASEFSVWQRLIWQAWRQMRVTLTLILGFPMLASLAFIVHAVFFLRGPSDAFRYPLTFAPGIAVFVGATLFWADQRNGRYGFLAQRGVSPRRVWASRQVLGIAAVVAYYAFALLCLGGELSHRHSIFRIETVVPLDASHASAVYQISRQAIIHVLQFVGLGVVLYGVGQACSLMIRSGPIALFIGLLGGWAAAMWAGLMWHFEVPLWFSVAPIPLALLWAGWLRAPDWMNQRVRWRHRGKLLLSVVAPLLAVVGATICFRVYEIPARTPNLPAATSRAAVSREALKTAWAYLGADADTQSLADFQPPSNVDVAIARFVEASRRPECVFPSLLVYEDLRRDPSVADLADVFNHIAVVTRTSGLVLDRGDDLAAEGRLDEALDRYCAVLGLSRHFRHGGDWHRQWQADMIEADVWRRLVRWAAAAGQTAERIRKAIARLDQEHFSVPVPRRDAILEDSRWLRRGLEMELTAMQSMDPNEAFARWFVRRFLPWEHNRSLRLLDASTAYQLDRLAFIESRLASIGTVRWVQSELADKDQQMQRWLRTTPLFWGVTRSGSTLDEILARCETQRRIARLRLELMADRAEHGALPETVGPFDVQNSATDPFSGTLFLYRPRGLAEPISVRPDMGLELWTSEKPAEEILPAGTPFLWSAGPGLFYRGKRGPLDLPREANFGDFTYRPAGSRTAYDVTSEQELWSLGQCFPIPPPAP